MDSSIILKNTGYMYFRMFFILLVSLYTSRVILHALGVTDFGIYNVVGGIVVLASFVSNTLRDSIQRYFSYYIGREDSVSLNTLYATAVILHIIVAVILLLSSFVGYWFIEQYLVIPLDRIQVAKQVYFYAVLGMCVTLVSIPSTALIISEEKFNVVAVIGIVEGCLKLLFSIYVLNYNGDRLLLFSILVFCLNFLISLINILYVKFTVTYLRFSFKLDMKLIKEIAAFSGWNTFGAFSNLFVSNGTNVVLNMFYPPSVSAARGISYQVMGAVRQFSSNFQSVINPQIIKKYSANDLSSFWRIVFCGSRISFLLFLLVCSPIFFYVNSILSFWLGEYPLYTPIFVQLVLLNALFESLTYPITTAIRATGRIKKYQVLTGGALCSAVIISYFVLSLGGQPYFVFIVNVVITLITLILRFYIVYTNIEFPIVLCKQLIVRLSVVLLMACAIGFLVHYFVRWVILGGILLTIFNLLIIYFCGLNPEERKISNNYFKARIFKLFIK